MSEKINCNIIRDILPSYADGLCSEESENLVKEHVKSCPECREILENMQADMKSGGDNVSVDTEKIMKDVKARMAADVRQKTKRYRIAIVCIIILVAILFVPLKNIPENKMQIAYQNYYVADYIDTDSAIKASDAMTAAYEGSSILLDDEANPDEALVYLIDIPGDKVGKIYADELWIEKHEYLSIVEVKAKYDMKIFASHMEGDIFVVDKAKTSILSGEKSGYSGQIAMYGQNIAGIEIK